MAKATPHPVLPKRYRPFLGQALNEADLRYGAQEAGFRSLLSSTTHDYSQQSAAQSAATRSLLGAYASAPADLSRVYSDAGLTPSLLGSIANSPTGQRLAGEQARAQAGIQQQTLGAKAGGAYQQQHLFDQYRQDVGKINDQASAEQHERGVFTSSLLDQLIGSDKAARAAAQAAAQQQQFTADQNALNRESTQTNALIGAWVDPITGQVLPGHGPKAKPQPRATPHAQAVAESAFSQAVDHATQMIQGGISQTEAAKSLVAGRKAQKGKPVYDPKTGLPRLQPAKLPDGSPNPLANTPQTAGDVAPVDPVEPAIAQAAVDMATRGYLTRTTVTELHRQGYRVHSFPGVRLWSDRNAPGKGLPASHTGHDRTASDGRGGSRPT